VCYGATPFNCDLKALDDAGQDVFLLGNYPSEPTTKAALTGECDRRRKSLEFSNEFANNCVDGIGKGMIKLFLEGAGKIVEGQCTEGHEVQNSYLKVAECLSGKAGEAINKCNRVVTGFIESNALNSLKTHKIPQNCCFMAEYTKCVVDSASPCGQEGADYVKNAVDAYIGDLLDTVCAKWKPGSKACKELPKLVGIANPKYKTLLPPSYQLLQSIQ